MGSIKQLLRENRWHFANIHILKISSETQLGTSAGSVNLNGKKQIVYSIPVPIVVGLYRRGNPIFSVYPSY